MIFTYLQAFVYFLINSRVASFRQQNDFRTAYLYYFTINKIVE